MSHIVEDLIRQHVHFEKVAATGFHQVKCPVCNDTRPRGGFVFHADSIGYSCFRGKCDANTVYKYGERVPYKFKRLMKAFGITLPPEILLEGRSSFNDTLDTELYEVHSYKPVAIPDDFELYDPDIHTEHRDWLREKRGLSDTLYMIGHKKEWRGRLIVPFFFHETIIGWQGVYIHENSSFRGERYLKSSGNTDMLFLPDGKIPDEPLIVEGVFDAKSIPNGIACLQSYVSRKQAYFLRNKNPILIPDRKGSRYMETAKRYGWRICIPDFDEKDCNEALKRYGKLVLAKKLHDGLCPNLLVAETRYNMWKITDE